MFISLQNKTITKRSQILSQGFLHFAQVLWDLMEPKPIVELQEI